MIPAGPRAMRAWDIPSPCIGVCRLDPDDGRCQGCWRSMAEIAAWPGMDADQRLALLDVLARRRDADDDRPDGSPSC